MTFTVKDLKEQLDGLPDDMLVYVQADSEGNGYRKCAGIDPDCVVTEDDYHAEIASASYSADDMCLEEDEWADILKQPRVLVIYPS